jgi:hypothetical protein
VDIDLGLDMRIILERILGKLWTTCMWLRIRNIGGPCEHNNEHSASIKDKEFLDQLSDC